jgi:hypothetical protein
MRLLLIFFTVPLLAQTTLSNPSIPFRTPEKPYVILRRGPVEIVVVTNEAVRDEVLPDHRAGYSGIAKITHKAQSQPLFVPSYAGLNFEHILDGRANAERRVQFEPRNHPMELRVINNHTAELCQSPTFHLAVASCQRYELLPDGVIDLTIDVQPTQARFPNNYINLFWASYIHQPESLDIHFRGPGRQWIRGVTPAHGERSTHPGANDTRQFQHDEPFPLTLVFSLSGHRFAEPWYFGIARGMAFVQMFRAADQVRFTQSPSGGGKGNPAWDFQYFISNPEPGRIYNFRMRAAYLPYKSHEQIDKATRKHRQAIN